MFTDNEKVTEKVDIYAVGILVYFLQSGGSYPHNCNETLSSYRKSTHSDNVSLVSDGEDKDFFSEPL